MAKHKMPGHAKKMEKRKPAHMTPDEKVHVVMGEFKRGTLRSGGSGAKVTKRKQAIAISLSEAGLSKPTRRAGGRGSKGR